MLTEVVGAGEEVDDPNNWLEDVDEVVEAVDTVDEGKVWVGARATPAIPEAVRLGMAAGACSMIAGKLAPAALRASAKSSFAFEGMVDTKPIRGGSTEGLVKFP